MATGSRGGKSGEKLVDGDGGSPAFRACSASSSGLSPATPELSSLQLASINRAATETTVRMGRLLGHSNAGALVCVPHYAWVFGGSTGRQLLLRQRSLNRNRIRYQFVTPRLALVCADENALFPSRMRLSLADFGRFAF
jgi:hypothetical protein